MSSRRTLVANARMLSHDYRDIVGVRRSDISRTAGARVYYEHGIKIRLQSRKEVEVLITRQSGKGVDFGWIELGINQEATGIAMISEYRFHPHITLGGLPRPFYVTRIRKAPTEVLFKARSNQNHAICSGYNFQW